MKVKVIAQLLILFLSFNLYAQERLNNPELDHSIFIEDLNNNSDIIYNKIISTYNDYLRRNPTDALIHIEKCKFIEYAQYDDYDDYNPNQNEFDSCVESLLMLFPDNPDVLIYHATFQWGEKKLETLDKAKVSIKNNPLNWDNKQLGELYFEMAGYYYYNEDYDKAYINIKKAISAENKFENELIFVQILIENDRKVEALEVLKNDIDTTKSLWELSQTARLLIELYDYKSALDIYNLINDKDSSYNNNSEIAFTLSETGKYAMAREYLVADTTNSWYKGEKLLNLFLHDLKHNDKDTCIESYNSYRDMGYSMDPIAIYRLKVFFYHPFLPWKFRDISGILILILLISIIIITPSIWILPVHFIGHRWKIINDSKEFIWGLKSFWFISTGYLLGQFASMLVVPEVMHSWINWEEFTSETTQKEEGASFLLFISILAIFTLISLYKINLKVFTPKIWTFARTLSITIGVFLVYKFIVSTYIKMGISLFLIQIEDLMAFPNILLSSREDIIAILSTYGNITGFLLFAVLVPIYEEIIFRGIILKSVRRYIQFRWANIFQAVLFATIHGELFLFPVFFSFGLITGILNKRSGGLFAGIIFHLINNMLAIYVLISRGM